MNIRQVYSEIRIYLVAILGLLFLIGALHANAEDLSPPGIPGKIFVPSGTVSNGSFTVSWYSGSRAINYELQEQKNVGPWISIFASRNRSYTASGRGPGDYRYRVRAKNTYGTSSWRISSVVNYRVGPAVVTVSGKSDAYDSSYTVNWNAISGAGAYVLVANVDGECVTFYCIVGVYPASNRSVPSSELPVEFLGQGTHTFAVAACDAGYLYCVFSTGISLTIQQAPGPMVSASFWPSKVRLGGQSTLSWSSTNATSCTGVPSQSSSAPSDSKSHTLNQTSDWLVTITCSGPGGSASATAKLRYDDEELPDGSYVGDLNSDGLLDFYIAQSDSPLSDTGSFVLQQRSDNTFDVLAPLTAHQKGIVRTWDFVPLELIPDDFNLDGKLDLFVRGIEGLITNGVVVEGFDQLVFAPTAGLSAPSTTASLTPEFRQFFQEVYDWLLNPNYFEENAAVRTTNIWEKQRVYNMPLWCDASPFSEDPDAEFFPYTRTFHGTYEDAMTDRVVFRIHCRQSGGVVIYRDYDLWYWGEETYKDYSAFSKNALEFAAGAAPIVAGQQDSLEPGTVPRLLEILASFGLAGVESQTCPQYQVTDAECAIYITANIAYRILLQSAAVSIFDSKPTVIGVEYAISQGTRLAVAAALEVPQGSIIYWDEPSFVGKIFGDERTLRWTTPTSSVIFDQADIDTRRGKTGTRTDVREWEGVIGVVIAVPNNRDYENADQLRAEMQDLADAFGVPVYYIRGAHPETFYPR
jgi:hypothetical protein